MLMKRALLFVALALAGCDDPNTYHPIPGNLIAIDGDTFRNGSERFRLARIDAPEMPGHCRPGRQCVAGDPYASQRALQWLLDQTSQVICRTVDVDRYGRKVVECIGAGATNLSDAMLGMGQAQPYHFDHRLTAANH
jgi:micrococcal nuclease